MTGDAKEETQSLAAKLAKIGKEIGALEKSGHNDLQRYDYIEYGVVAGRIRELLDKYGVAIIPEVVDYERDEVTNSKGGKGYHYVLNMHFTIVNADDHEDTQEANWLGEGIDYGDKGVNKAETAGVKYFLMRLFNVSEKGEKDADADSPEVEGTTPIAKGLKNQTYTRGLNFKLVRDRLAGINDLETLRSYWQELKLTENQARILEKDFTKRKTEIGGDI